jgi:hypothetical protein
VQWEELKKERRHTFHLSFPLTIIAFPLAISHSVSTDNRPSMNTKQTLITNPHWIRMERRPLSRRRGKAFSMRSGASVNVFTVTSTSAGRRIPNTADSIPGRQSGKAAVEHRPRAADVNVDESGKEVEVV